jgi:hypothetical protein
MPYAFATKHIKLQRQSDRRVRITDDDKEKIKVSYQLGESIRGIERTFHGRISRRSIQFILFPERREIAQKQFKQRRKDGRYYPGKEKWAKIMREHRQYKQSIIKTKICHNNSSTS